MEADFFEEEETRSELEFRTTGIEPILVQYTNQQGRTTEREIVPLAFYEKYGHQYVRAYCYLRHGERTFALRRMTLSDGVGQVSMKGNQEAAFLRSCEGAGDAGDEEDETETSVCRDIGRLEIPVNTGTISACSAPVGSPGISETARESRSDDSGLFAAFRRGFRNCLILFVGAVLLAQTPLGEAIFDIYVESTDGAAWILPSLIDSSAEAWNGGSNEMDKSSGAGGSFSSASAGAVPSVWTYRGFEMRRDSAGRVFIPALGQSFASGREAHFMINVRGFQKETGFTDRMLVKIYMNADSDRNGHLSWREVAEFQRRTYRTFEYRHNNTALNPADFLAQRGGDCEDFALFTCGMLRFWGWNCKVAGFYPPDGGYGHAIVMVWSASPINGYGSIRIDQGHMVGSTFMQAGYWIPIDYDSIGAFSNAMGNDWSLWDLDRPEDLYGRNL